MICRVLIFIVVCIFLTISYCHLRSSVNQQKLEITGTIENIQKDIKGLEFFSKEPMLTKRMINKYDQQHGTNLTSQLYQFLLPSSTIVALAQREVLLTKIKEKQKDLEKAQNKGFLDYLPIIIFLGACHNFYENY